MRTLLPDELKEQPLVKLAVGFTLVVMVGFVVTGFLLYFQHMDLSPESVETYYAGSSDQYLPARAVESMLGVTHAHTIALGVTLLLLSFLLIRSSVSETTKKAFIVLPFASAILNEMAPWLVRYDVPLAAWIKILSFLALELSLMGLILVLFVATFRGPRRQVEQTPIQRPPLPPRQRSGPQGQQPRAQQGGPQSGQQGGPGGDARRRRRRPRRRRGGGGKPAGPAPSPGGPPPSA